MKIRLFFIASVLVVLMHGNLMSQSGWFALNSGISSHLSDVVVLDTNTVIVAGENFFVLRSTNGGAEFDSIYLPLAYSIKKFSFINENTGYLLSYSIYKTTNKGESWQFVSDDPLDESYDIDFINENTGIVTGVDTWPFSQDLSPVAIYGITTTGGNNWSVSFLQDLGSANFVKMFDENNIFTIVYNRLHKTSNSGINWNSYFMPVNSVFNFFIQSTDVLYSAGYNGSIEKTTNSGVNWFNQSSGTNEHLNRIFFINENTGWIVGNNGTIIYTFDAGNQWFTQISTVSDFLAGVHFLNEFLGFAVGRNGVIIKTVTGGLVNIISSSQTIPETFKLHQNYPNPFNPVTNIRFDIPPGGSASEHVILKIYNSLGQEVALLLNQQFTPGSYEFLFNGNDFASGVYYYELSIKNFTQFKRMVLIK